MKQDLELAQRIRVQWAENFAKVAPSALPPDLELRSLSRTRKLLGVQRWLFGFGIFFSALLLSNEFSFADHHLNVYVREVSFNAPQLYVPCAINIPCLQCANN